jgi:hypothetical protein
MTQDLTPMEVCVRLIGPEPAIAGALGYARSGPWLWHKPAKGRDAGDLPSTKIMRALLSHSRTHNLGLTADHLIWGASEAEIADIMALRALAEGARAIETQPAFASRRTRAA